MKIRLIILLLTLSQVALAEPLIKRVSKEAMVIMVFPSMEGKSQRELYKFAKFINLNGFYDNKKKTIYIWDWIDPADPEYDSIITHEMVHHWQYEEERQYKCKNARETEAYNQENEYRVANWLKPVSQEHINKVSTCLY